MTTESPETPASICSHCLSGYILPGTPRGVFQDLPLANASPLAKLKTYVALPADGQVAKGRAVILATDLYGLGITNPLLMADMFADRLHVPVYVPDLLEGEYPDATQMNTIDTPISHLPFLERLSARSKVAKNLWTIGPGFMLRHNPDRQSKLLKPFITQLRLDLQISHLGLIGYCAGGQQAIMISSSSHSPALIQAASINHPGPASDSLLKALNPSIPLSFAFAEEDEFFGVERQETARKLLAGRNVEFVNYPGTTHGFAARPNLGIENVKLAWKGAFEQAVGHMERFVVRA